LKLFATFTPSREISDYGTDSNSDGGSDDNEAFRSASDVLNEEDKAELAEYDTQMAEAWRIHNKYHGNPAEDSDSELSASSNSLFNGMDGIETGGANKV
jgi:hypothetical protein